MTGGSVSIELNVMYFHCSLTLRGKLALPGGGLGSVSRFVPGLSFLPLLHCRPACPLGLR